MALTYRLRIKTKIPLLNFVEKYLVENNILFSRESINKGVNIYLNEALGFMISVGSFENIFFDYLVSENHSTEEEWDYSNDIYFIIDKSYDSLLVRLNMIEICSYVLSNTNEDARLLFNGDILVFERTNGIITTNKNFGFWNSDDLLDKMKLIM